MNRPMGAFAQKCEKLYEEFCAKQEDDPNSYFTQEDIMADGVGEDEIAKVINYFLERQYTRLLTDGGRLTCYKFRHRDIADKLVRLSLEDMLVYGTIEETGLNGLWTKAMLDRTKVSRPVLNKAIKTLEGKKLIKSVTSVKAPAKKIYILYHLQATEDVSGNIFYDGGELDMAMITEISHMIMNWVTDLSWSVKEEVIPDASYERPKSAAELKRKQAEIHRAGGGGKDGSAKFKPPRAQTRTVILPYPPSYEGYPDLRQVHEMLNSSNVLNGIELTLDNVQDLLNALVWDGQLEVLKGDVYRVVRSQLSVFDPKTRSRKRIRDMEDEGNGFTETPCSRCPVFDLCEPGGPVSAANCEYFDQWLHPEKHKMVDLGDGYMVTPREKEKRDKMDAQVKELESQRGGSRA